MPEKHWLSENAKYHQPDSAMASYVFLGVLFALCLVVEFFGREIEPFQKLWEGLGVRILYDLCFYFVAGGLGVAVAHSVVKRSMAITNTRLRGVVAQSLRELNRMLPPELRKKEEVGKDIEQEGPSAEDRSSNASDENSPLHQDSSTKETLPIPLPVPYIIAKLGDMRPKSFGYFGGKLLMRDPRLLLDLSLDVSLKPNQSEVIWEMKQQIAEANKKTDKPPTRSHGEHPQSEPPQRKPSETEPLDKTPGAGELGATKKGDQTLAESIDAVLKAIPSLLTVLDILQRKKQANEANARETGPSKPPKSEQEE
jgi:hypothetical protein